MINLRPSLIVLTAATLLLVSACETIQKEAESFKKLIGSTGDSTTLKKGTAFEQFQSDGFNFASIISDRKKSLSLARNQGRGLVHSPALLTYVNDVLAKLTNIAPVTGVPARAYIADSESIYARATPSGEIFLTLNLLNHLKTEDELAFVLAHEFSHIIYRHHEADYLKKTQSRALKGFDLGYDLLKSRPETKSTKGRFPLSEYMLVGEASLLVSQDFVAPTWTRDQEDAADMLGLDMVAKAGYSLKPIFALFNKLASAQTELIKIKATPKQRFAQHMAVELKSPGLESYFTTAIAEFSSFFDRTFKRTPRTPKEREEFLLKYSKLNSTASKPTTSVLWNIKTPRKGRKFKNRKSVLTLFHHYDSADKAMAALKDTKIKKAVSYARIAVSGSTQYATSPRLAFHEIRKHQGKWRKAEANVRLARQGKEVALASYLKAIKFPLSKKKWKRVSEIIEEARERLGDPPQLYPLRINVYRKLGHMTDAIKLMTQCRQEYPNLATACQNTNPNMFVANK